MPMTIYSDCLTEMKKEACVFLAFNGYNINVNFNDMGCVNVDIIRLVYERVSSRPCDHRN